MDDGSRWQEEGLAGEEQPVAYRHRDDVKCIMEAGHGPLDTGQCCTAPQNIRHEIFYTGTPGFSNSHSQQSQIKIVT